MAHTRFSTGTCMRLRLLLGLAVVGLTFAGVLALSRGPLGPPLPNRMPDGSFRSGLVGSVRDLTGPVPGAIVRVKGTGAAAVSDADGRFSLKGPAKQHERVTAWKEGYLIAGDAIGQS